MFKPKKVPVIKYQPNVPLATNIADIIFLEDFKPMADKYDLNYSELLRQMVYHCLDIKYEPKPKEV